MVDVLQQLRILKDGLAGGDGRLEALFSLSDFGVCVIGPDGTFQRLNPAWEHCLGHQPDSMLAKAMLDFVHPSDRDATESAIARLADEDAVRFRNRFLQNDGKYRTLQWVASRADASGAICATVRATGRPSAAARSLETVSAAETVSASVLGASPAELYRKVVETSPDAIIVTDLGGKILLVNEQAAIQNGLESVEELMGLNAFDYIAPQDRVRAAENARLTLETGGVRNVEYELVRRDGTRVAVELNASVIKDAAGVPRGFIATVRDVTERKRAAEAQDQSEERYRILYQDNPSMYFTVDVEGTVLSVNQFGAEQLGYEPDELLGKPVLEVFYSQDRREVAEQLSACVAAPGAMRNWEFRKVRKDGQVIWVKEAARATKDANGETIVLIVCEDITERRQMEEELQNAREALERKVERRMKRGRAYGLTFREMTVLHLVAAGNSDREIARTLGISPLTVSKHVANVLKKMQSATRSEASARAVRESIVD